MSVANRRSNRLSGTFAVNWEVQAQQLKYSVKKEVEEGNLIQEAIKSLQRSYDHEEGKKELAEKQTQDLLQQIEELERTARDLKEKIRLTRRARKGKLDSEPDSDSDDSVEEKSKYEQEDDEYVESHMEGYQLDEFEFDEFISEIKEEDTERSQSQMTIQQRLKILKGLDSTSMDGEKPKKKSLEHYKEKHKKIMKQWIKRENTTKAMFEESQRVNKLYLTFILLTNHFLSKVFSFK